MARCRWFPPVVHCRGEGGWKRTRPSPETNGSPPAAALLAKEKDFTRRRDRLSAERRALPWVKVDKAYRFDTTEGSKTLADLFGGRSQLVVDHFMLGPGWGQGCVGCSFGADHIGCLVHLEHHDVSVVVVSRAPLAEIEAYKKRMGWRFDWVSSFGSDFNFDYHVSFTPEDLAKGKVYYNYRETDGGIEECPASAFSSRTRPAKSSIPTPVMPAAPRS